MSNIPCEWKFVTIEKCCEVLDRYRIPVNAEERDTRIGEIPYYGANGLQGFIDAHIFDEPLILIAEDGGRFEEYATRPIAYRISGKSWVNNHAHVLRAKSDFDQDAIFYALEHKDIQYFIVGGTRAKLNQSALKAIEIQLPDSKVEQSKIAEVLATVDQAIEQTEALIAKQQRIKTGLMQDLLTRGIDEHGQLRTEQTHAFKDSPLGRIPVEWEVVPFNHFVEKLESGVSVNADDQPCGSGQVGVLKTSAMYAGKFFPDQNKTVIHEDLQRVRVSPLKNTILISRMNTPNLVGESGFVEEDHPNLYLPDRIWMTKFRSGKEFSSRWMSFVLTSKPVRAFISLNATGTSGSMKNLPQKSLMGMLIATPTSESEFRQITKALIQSEASTNSDVEHLRKLKLIKTALMQDLLTGRKRVSDLLEPVAA